MSFGADIEVVFLCPRSACAELFIAYYHLDAGSYKLKSARPQEPTAVTFAESVTSISPSFSQIYGEAFKADGYGLKEICGVGYRKALEFLIKDYCISKNPGQDAAIRKVQLGVCIENYVHDTRIKEIAKRATWLGNDEAHYERRWVDKDLTDLKRTIAIVVHWIEMEYLTEQTLKDMP